MNSNFKEGVVYQCKVIDNSVFWKTGKIKVRICLSIGDLVTPRFKDFSEAPQDSLDNGKFKLDEEESSNIEMDTYAELSTCMGGAYDSGVFYLPQPNSYGLVTRIYSESETKPRFVWLGALITMDPLNGVIDPTDDANSVTQIDIPTDDISTHNGVENKNVNFVNSKNKNHAIVFKQKETYWSKDEDGITNGEIEDEDETKKSLDWRQAETINMAALDKDKVILVHNMVDDDNNKIGEAQISIDNKKGISIKFEKNPTENEEKYIASMELLNDGTATLISELDEGRVTNRFEATTEKLNIEHRTDDTVGRVFVGTENLGNTQTEKQMKIEFTDGQGQGAKQQTIVLSKSKIDITCTGDIQLNPEGNITIGAGTSGNYLLAYPSAGIADSGAISNFEASSVVAVKKIRV